MTTALQAVETVPAVITIPAQPILNADFEANSIAPWEFKIPTTGEIETVNGVNLCVLVGGIGTCAGGTVAIRSYPPLGGYVAIVQDFQARPSTTYSFSFWVRCLNYDGNAGVDALYAGALIGGMRCFNNNVAKVTGILFKTDASGWGRIEIRFINPSALPYLYFYADNFMATAE